MMTQTIEELRQQINLIDQQLLELLVQRFVVTHQVGVYKNKHDLPIFDAKREQQIIQKVEQQLQQYKDVEPQYILPVIQSLMEQSKKEQKEYHNE